MIAGGIQEPTLRNFFRAFGARWFISMSGPTTVPFAVAAVFVPSTWQKVILVALAVLCGLLSSYWVWRIERQARNEEFTRAAPHLDILWNPTDGAYRFDFQRTGVNILFRVCVVNTSHAHPVVGVQVRMESLTPRECPCIPACLRLMNDFGERLAERFDLTAGGSQFVDVIQQNLNTPEQFYIWHVVKPISTAVKAQPYRFTILVTADNAPPASREFEMCMDGSSWTMRSADSA
jgi:hypothetical protein